MNKENVEMVYCFNETCDKLHNVLNLTTNELMKRMDNHNALLLQQLFA